MSKGRFKERVAVVTGGASGIGLAISKRFAEEGASVAILDRNGLMGETVREEIRAAGGSCVFIDTDVAIEKDIIGAIEKTVEAFQRIDHVINNAGIVIVKGIEECTCEEWDRVLAVNLRSVFFTVKHALRWLRSSPNPSVVNIGSVSSLIGQQGTPAYVASKGGVLLLSKALALDLAVDRIRVNCVCPGITDTPMFRFHVNTTRDPELTLRNRFDRVPLRRALDPLEVANSVLYLAGEESSGVTGTSLVVDAGYTAAAEWSQTEQEV